MVRTPPPACNVVSGTAARTVKDWQATQSTDHFVQFYRTEDYLIECLAAYAARGIWTGESVIVIATPSHRVALEERLRIKSVDVASNVVSGHYLALDAQEMLSKFMFAGRPNPVAFRAAVGDVFDQLAKAGRPLRAFGEMVALLWMEDNREGAIALEQLWNDLARDYTFSLFCAYPSECMAAKEGRPTIDHVCHTHSCVIPFTA
jgi:hypothetical protein